MTSPRQTGIFMRRTSEASPSDYSDFLTGNLDTDRKRVSMLLTTLASVNSNVDLQDVLIAVVDRSVQVTGAERGILMLYDDEKVLRIRLARDNKGRDLGTTLQYSHSVAMRVARDGQGICLIDTANQDQISLGQSILDLKLLTVMCVPLVIQDRMIGLLYVDSKASSGEFSAADLTLFKALAGQVAVAVDNARLLSHYVEKQRLQESLSVASDIQRSLLPRGGLTTSGMEIHGLYEGCEETSGDYFDYIRRSGGRLGLVVGDVAGHGIGAALVMSTARALLRAFAASDCSPAQLVTRLNRFLSQDVETGRFMTLFYGEVDLRSRVLTYVRAGHNEPLLYRRQTDSFEELGHGGIALGVIDDFEFEAAEPVHLSPGDQFLMYTDGIIEAMDAHRVPFGKDRLQTLLRECRDLPARETVGRIHREVVAFVGADQQEDDFTLVLARMT